MIKTLKPLAYWAYNRFPAPIIWFNRKRFNRWFRNFWAGKPPHPSTGLISTMPKSGTLYLRYFLFFYDQLLKGNEDPVPMVLKGPSDIMRMPVRMPSTLGLDLVFICHSSCPGFHRHKDSLGWDWDSLNYYSPAFDYAGPLFEAFPQVFDPVVNPGLKVVYVYRNPLDQGVSFFRYARKNLDETMTMYRDASGRNVRISSVRDYLLGPGTDAYIKQLATYRVMKEKQPERIMLVTYERLIREPEATLSAMLGFLGHDVSGRRAQFERALALSSRDSMKAIENAIGGSLRDDQRDVKERHVRDGSAGQWRSHISGEDLAMIEAKFSKHALPLSEFEIG